MVHPVGKGFDRASGKAVALACVVARQLRKLLVQLEGKAPPVLREWLVTPVCWNCHVRRPRLVTGDLTEAMIVFPVCN